MEGVKVEFRLLDKSDYLAWALLFEEVFNAQMSKFEFEHKYKDALIVGAGAFINGKLLAFYGGMPRDVFLRQKVIKAVQIGDVMVHQSQRGAFSKKGLFFQAATNYLENFVGQDKIYEAAFGFPNPRAYELGFKLKLYSKVDSLLELSWDTYIRPLLQPISENASKDLFNRIRAKNFHVTEVAFKFFITRPIEFNFTSHFTNRLQKRSNTKNLFWRYRDFKDYDIKHIDSIWKNMLQSLPNSAICAKNAAWFYERYINRIDKRYKIIVVQKLFKVKAVLVLCDKGEHGVEIIDIVGDANGIKQYVNMALKFAFNSEIKRVFCWITKSHIGYFQSSNPQVQDANIIIPITVHSKETTQEEFQNSWWLMAGDTDFK